MLIIFNLPGIIMVVLGFLIAFFIDHNMGKIGYLIFGVIIGASDLLYRSMRKSALEDISFFHPKRGGNIFFIPVWIIGVIVVIYGLFW